MTQVTALLLLAMSVASWAVIPWKLRPLRRASADLPRHRRLLAGRQPGRCRQPRAALRPRIPDPAAGEAAHARWQRARRPACWPRKAARAQQLTRVLRDALHGVLRRLQWGQVLLATVV